MNPREKKRLSKKAFESVFLCGDFSFSGNVALKWKKREDFCVGIAVTVAKKKVSFATKRNRIKRQLRAGMDQYAHKLVIACDIVILYQGKLQEVETRKLWDDLEGALRKARLLTQ